MSPRRPAFHQVSPAKPSGSKCTSVASPPRFLPGRWKRSSWPWSEQVWRHPLSAVQGNADSVARDSSLGRCTLIPEAMAGEPRTSSSATSIPVPPTRSLTLRFLLRGVSRRSARCGSDAGLCLQRRSTGSRSSVYFRPFREAKCREPACCSINAHSASRVCTADDSPLRVCCTQPCQPPLSPFREMRTMNEFRVGTKVPVADGSCRVALSLTVHPSKRNCHPMLDGSITCEYLPGILGA